MKRYNVTLDDETVNLLGQLGQHYGIKDRSSVIRFIAKQTARELRKEQTMSEYNGWTIKVGMNPDSMGDLTGYDAPASIGRFRELVEEQLTSDYPDATIDVYYNDGLVGNRIEVYGSNPLDTRDDEVTCIEARIASVFEQGDWAIEL